MNLLPVIASPTVAAIGTVASVESRTISIPLRKPLRFSTRYVERRDYTVVRIRTTAGVEGTGYCYCGNRAGHFVTQFVRDFFAEHVVGAEPTAVEALWTTMYRDGLLLGRRGAALRAMSAIDLALWDVIGKSTGLPLHRLLGGPKFDRVPCYASGGYYWNDVDPTEYIFNECRQYVEAGFSAVKIKVGGLPIKQEMERARAARDAIGSDVALMMDANNAWPDATTAIPAIKALAEVRPFWIEEPLLPDDVKGHATIRRTTRVPVATGEIEATRWGFAPLLEQSAVDMLQPDATVLGGITEFRKVAALAAAYDVPLYPHWMHHLNVSIVAAIPNAVMVEYFPDRGVLNLGDVLLEEIKATGGTMPLPQQPGLGFEFDPHAVDRFATDRWA